MNIDLNKSPLSALVAEFNKLTGEKVKRFPDRKTAIKRLASVMPKPKKGEGRAVTVRGSFKTVKEAIDNNSLKGTANKKAIVKMSDGYRVVCFMTARSKSLEVVGTV